MRMTGKYLWKSNRTESESVRSVLWIAVLLSCVMFSCKEVGPNINLTGNGGDTSGNGNVDSTQLKNVLIEDFTATNCTNCPKGRDIIDNLINQNPGRIVVVEVHQGQLSYPLLPGDPALKTQDGEDLANILLPSFWPSGAIDRERIAVAPGDTELCVDRGLWTSYATQELDSVLKVKISINTNYDDLTRLLTGSVTINFLQAITEPLNLTVLITESGIQAAQLDAGVLDSFYHHRDVLRDIITNVEGNPVNSDQLGGSSWTYNVPSYPVSVGWQADSCRIIAFVSRAAGSYQVLQATGIPMK